MDPYRDELESLRAENARLRRELGARRVVSGRLAALLVLTEAGAVIALRPWLNGASDVGFWGSAVILTAIAGAAAAAAWGIRKRG